MKETAANKRLEMQLEESINILKSLEKEVRMVDSSLTKLEDKVAVFVRLNKSELFKLYPWNEGYHFLAWASEEIK